MIVRTVQSREDAVSPNGTTSTTNGTRPRRDGANLAHNVRVMTTHLASNAAPALIELRGVTKTYPHPAGAFMALDDITLTIDRGEFAVVVGQSGSGKSTLLGLVAGIDRPTRGSVVVDGASVHALTESAMSVWRGRAVGIVFQFFQLLPTLTAAENVMLPMDFCSRWPVAERRERAIRLLERCGVADQADKLPATLSGGQQQRVAIARAMANDPPVVLADEPMGNLDSRTSEAILELFAGIVREGRTVIMVTHDRGAERFATRSIALADGRIAPATVAA